MLFLAQAQAALFTADSLFGWPILIAIATLGAWAARQQSRLDQQEKDLSALGEEMKDMGKAHAALAQDVKVATVVLARLDVMVTALHNARFPSKESA